MGGTGISGPRGGRRGDAPAAPVEGVDLIIDLRSQPRPEPPATDLVIPTEVAPSRPLRVISAEEPTPRHRVDPPKASPRLERKEPLAVGLKRMVLEQLDVALAHLDDLETNPHESVHEIRKAFKRCRGLIRLVRDEVGYDVYRPENVVLRDLGRKLAPLRDTTVKLETIGGLRERYASVLTPDAFSTLSEGLEALRRAQLDEWLEDEHRRAAFSVTLRAARARYAAWPAEDQTRGLLMTGAPVRNSYKAIEPGVRRVYYRGRRAGKLAKRTKTMVDLHEWRKRVKYLRYQLEALSPLWKDVIGGTARAVDRLGELLGEDHDYAVLAEAAHDPTLCPDKVERYLLIAIARERRRRLQTAAFPLGAKLYAESPRAFTARLGEYWTAARS